MILVCPHCKDHTIITYMIFLRHGQIGGVPHKCDNCGKEWIIKANFEEAEYEESELLPVGNGWKKGNYRAYG